MKAFLARVLVACFVAFLCVSPARAQEPLSDVKRADIARLIQVTAYFTHEEIKGMLQFYTSPLGKKAIQAMPNVTQDSMAVGQKWGGSLGKVIEERLSKRLEAEGFK